MHLSSTAFGALLLAGGAAANPRCQVCGDKLYQCFTESLALASEYCSNSLGLVSTVTATEVPIVTSTYLTTLTTATTVGFADVSLDKRVTRVFSEPQQLGCVLTSRTWAASRWTSVCSRIGITSRVDTITSAADASTVLTSETVTVTETSTSSASVASSILSSSAAPSSIASSVVSSSIVPSSVVSSVLSSLAASSSIASSAAPSSASPSSVVSSSVDLSSAVSSPAVSSLAVSSSAIPSSVVSSSAAASSSAAPVTPVPILTNPGFEDGLLAPWVETQSAGVIYHAQVIAGGSRGSAYSLNIEIPYPVFGTVGSVTVRQTLTCEPNTWYNIALDTKVLTSQPTGNLWSVKVQGTTFVSGAGATVSPAVWYTHATAFRCSTDPALRYIELSASSNYLRGGSFSFDNIVIEKSTFQ